MTLSLCLSIYTWSMKSISLRGTTNFLKQIRSMPLSSYTSTLFSSRFCQILISMNR